MDAPPSSVGIGFLLHWLPVGLVPFEVVLALISCSRPVVQCTVVTSSAKGSGCCWKHSSVKDWEDGQRRNW